MEHIEKAMQNILKNSSKAKFFYGNRKNLVRYFDSHIHYNSLVLAGRFQEMEEIIKEKSDFDKEEFCLALGNNLKDIVQ